jgi:hypothetical protein
MKTLSSFQTLSLKTVLPLLPIFLFSIAIYTSWPRDPGGAHILPSLGVLALEFTLLAAVAVLFLRGGARLKHVQVDEMNLYVSNYVGWRSIPLAMIDAVTQDRWLNLHPVTIHLRCDTPFGRKIVFIPGSGFGRVPVLRDAAAELKVLAKTGASGQGNGS